jgi:branched-chain amino acid transport system substrate-binding protein
MKRTLGSALALLSLFGLVLPAVGPSPSFAADDKFVIGISAPLSGINAVRGKYVKDAADFAVEQINAAGGVKGKKLVLVYEDNEGNPTKVVNTVTKLIEQQGASGLLVSDSSGTMASIPVVTKAKVPMFTTAFSPALTAQGSPYIFRSTVSDGITGKQVVEYAMKELKFEKIAIMASDEDYGMGAAEPAAKALKDIGKPAVAFEKFNAKDQDFSSLLLNVKKSGAQVVFIHTYDVPAALVTKQIHEMGLGIPVLGATGLASEQFRDLAGAANIDGLNVLVAFINTNPDPMVQDFVKQFKAKANYMPDHNSARSHAAVVLLAEAMKKAGSAQGEDVAKALHALKDVKLPGGTFTFDEKGEGAFQNMVGRWKSGKLEFVKEYK